MNIQSKNNSLLVDKGKNKQIILVEALEDYLGNPFNASTSFSFHKVLELDQQEIYPETLLNVLKGFSFSNNYIPEDVGGKFTSFEDLLNLLRLIARRDLSTCISEFYNALGFLGVWFFGNKNQCKYAAELLREGASFTIGISEKTNIYSEEIKLKNTKYGYSISGVKRPLSKANKSDVLILLGNREDASGATLLMVEKNKIRISSTNILPKITTLGIRGCDISGIKFSEVHLPQEFLLSNAEHPAEIVGQFLTLKRVLCAGLLLGSIDTALRSAYNYFSVSAFKNSGTINYQWTEKFSELFLDIIICEASAISIARCFQVNSPPSRRYSLMTKYIGQILGEEMLEKIARVFSETMHDSYNLNYEVFQKSVRDISIITLFDGGAPSTLQQIIAEYNNLFTSYEREKIKTEDLKRHLAGIYDCSITMEQYQPEAYFTNAETELISSEVIAVAIDLLETAKPEVDENVYLELKFYLEIIIAKTVKDVEQLFKLQNQYEAFHSAEIYRLVTQQCFLLTSINCIFYWLYNFRYFNSYFKSGGWLLLSLDKLLGNLIEKDITDRKEYVKSCFNEFHKQFSESKLFSTKNIQLGK